MDKLISHHVVEVCKQLGIDYTSINPNYVTFFSDTQKLVQLYRDLKEISAQLQEISEAHNINGLSQLLHDDIAELEKIEHDLIKVASKLKNDNA